MSKRIGNPQRLYMNRIGRRIRKIQRINYYG
jgi:hypothetical protein